MFTVTGKCGPEKLKATLLALEKNYNLNAKCPPVLLHIIATIFFSHYAENMTWLDFQQLHKCKLNFKKVSHPPLNNKLRRCRLLIWSKSSDFKGLNYGRTNKSWWGNNHLAWHSCICSSIHKRTCLPDCIIIVKCPCSLCVCLWWHHTTELYKHFFWSCSDALFSVHSLIYACVGVCIAQMSTLHYVIPL